MTCVFLRQETGGAHYANYVPEIFGVKDGAMFPKRGQTRRCNISWESRLLNPQKLFGVIGGVITTLINVCTEIIAASIVERAGPVIFKTFFTGIKSCFQTDSSNLSCKKSIA